MMMIITI